jgi:hypothetical protein
VPLIDQLQACRRGTVLQLAGAHQAGKSLLCMLTAINFIIPSEWRGVPLPGLSGALSSRLFLEACSVWHDFVASACGISSGIASVWYPATHRRFCVTQVCNYLMHSSSTWRLRPLLGALRAPPGLQPLPGTPPSGARISRCRLPCPSCRHLMHRSV